MCKRPFVQHAQAAAALGCPRIAMNLEIDETDGVNFIATELIQGKSFGRSLKPNAS